MKTLGIFAAGVAVTGLTLLLLPVVEVILFWTFAGLLVIGSVYAVTLLLRRQN